MLIELSRFLLLIVVSSAKLFLPEPEIGTSSCLVLTPVFGRLLFNLGVGRGGLQQLFFLLKFCIILVEVLRKIKIIFIAGKWASVPATSFWIFWTRTCFFAITISFHHYFVPVTSWLFIFITVFSSEDFFAFFSRSDRTTRPLTPYCSASTMFIEKICSLRKRDTQTSEVKVSNQHCT